MSLISKFAKVSIKIGGKGIKYGVKGIALGTSGICDKYGKYSIANDINRYSAAIGDGIEVLTQKGSNIVEKGIDKTIEISGYVGAEIGGYIAEKNGLDINVSRKVGATIGGGAVGLLAGEVVGSTISSIAAITGTTSTGTAISSLHGAAATKATLAHIGGGALSAGGGGIAAGYSVLNTIDAVSATVGGVTGAKYVEGPIILR